MFTDPILKKCVSDLNRQGWVIESVNYGSAIVEMNFPQEFARLCQVLGTVTLNIEDSIIKRGGGKTDQTKDLTNKLNHQGWFADNIRIENQVRFENSGKQLGSVSLTHEIDHMITNADGKIGTLEIEWNNRGEFFDRDIQAIRALYELSIIEVGIIIAHGPGMRDALKEIVDKYFLDHGIKKIEDFDGIAKRLEAKYGQDRFSFPTGAQKKSIGDKVRAGHSFTKAAASVFVDNKYAIKHTNWESLQKRIHRKDLGRSPAILIGIPSSVFC